VNIETLNFEIQVFKGFPVSFLFPTTD